MLSATVSTGSRESHYSLPVRTWNGVCAPLTFHGFRYGNFMTFHDHYLVVSTGKLPPKQVGVCYVYFTTYAQNRAKSAQNGGRLILRHGHILRILLPPYGSCYLTF